MNRDLEKKTEIRKQILSIRSQAGAERITRCSGLIFDRVIRMEAFRTADTIFAYMDCKNEVQTRQLIRKAWELGKQTAVPKVLGDRMEFYYIQSFSEVKTGCFQVPEPAGSPHALARDVDALVLVPGVAFDPMRNRIGYGKGYYDRYLSEHPGHPTIALAFSWQMVDAVPYTMYDIRPDCLVTEQKVYEKNLDFYVEL